MLSPRTIAAWAVLIVLVGVGMAVWLLLAYTGGDADTNRVQLDAIRTAGTIVVGTGGAAALLLAARRQRTAEIALKQKDRDQADVARAHTLQERVAAETRAHQERVAAATEHDAVERRVTELYTKAADQLGSDKAPVRLAGLYALERLAQDTPAQRQTIVNVLCAYLRMAYTLPGDSPGDHANANDEHTVHAVLLERVQEREVRLAAQRILATHLRPSADPTNQATSFWADIDLDLTGATLVDVDFEGCQAHSAMLTRVHVTGYARFTGAKFTGDARFERAEFSGHTSFDRVEFTGRASFERAEFAGHTWFNGAKFTGRARFDKARFTDTASFYGAEFTDIVSFNEARFTGHASFNEAKFISHAWFFGVKFTGDTRFDGATFTDDARFEGVEFTGPTRFSSAEFTGHALFDEARFTGDTSFRAVRFAGDVPAEVERFLSAPVGEAEGDAGP